MPSFGAVRFHAASPMRCGSNEEWRGKKGSKFQNYRREGCGWVPHVGATLVEQYCYYYWSAFCMIQWLDPHPILLGALHQMHRRGKITGGGCTLAKRENGSALSSTLLAHARGKIGLDSCYTLQLSFQICAASTLVSIIASLAFLPALT